MSKLKNTFILSFTSTCEYLDFILYAMLIPILNQVFFPTTSPWLATANSLVIFAIAYFVRPLGGLVFGILGDRLGRKSSYLASLLTMSLCSAMMAFLPTYQQIGITSSLLLMICRIGQGLAQGAQLPGAITLICERESKNKGFHCALLYTCVSLGASLAAGLIYGLNTALNTSDMLAFGWRLAFVVSSCFCGLALLLRNQLQDTAFKPSQTPQPSPISPLLRTFKLNLISAIMMCLMPAILILFKFTLPNLLTSMAQYQQQDVFLALSLSLAFSAIIHPLSGLLCDKMGAKHFMQIALLAMAIGLPGLFVWLPSLNLLMIVYQLLLSPLAVSFPPLIAALFPAPMRYTGVAVAYNTSFSVAALFPLLSSVMVHHGISMLIFSYLLSAMALLTLLLIRSEKQSFKTAIM